MRWIDLKEGVWTIPADHREKGTAGTLPLPRLALDVIEAQQRIAGNPYVFPADRGKEAFSAFSQRKDELDAKLKAALSDMEPWRLHDLRRTARSLMSRAGVRPEIAERVMGHAITGVEGVYDRHAYTAEKGDALNKLAHVVETIINPAENNVVSIAGRQ
jgi:integrase